MRNGIVRLWSKKHGSTIRASLSSQEELVRSVDISEGGRVVVTLSNKALYACVFSNMLQSLFNRKMQAEKSIVQGLHFLSTVRLFEPMGIYQCASMKVNAGDLLILQALIMGWRRFFI